MFRSKQTEVLTTNNFLTPLHFETSEPVNTVICNTNENPEMCEEATSQETYNKLLTTSQIYVNILDRVVPPRAVAVLPAALGIRRSGVISPRHMLPPRVRFGPVEGVKKHVSKTMADSLKFEASANNVPIFFIKDNSNSIHIDVSDKDKSNWISLLPLGDAQTANVWLYEENNALYAVTTESIPSRKPLKLGYSCNYAEYHGLPGPTKDIEEAIPNGKMPWWCIECQCVLPSERLLQRHNASHHKKVTPKHKYRCRHCTKTYGRLFTLRRHIGRHCPKKDKSANTVNFDNDTQDSLNAILNSDENRIPSDESFQNFSNGLDFSTNLFDTDRMSSLDISGITRTESDFAPYDIRYKDDHSLTADIETPYNEFIKTNQLIDKPKQVTCTYCNEEVMSNKKKKHARECPARRFECDCKKVFTNKELLADHIWKQHSNEFQQKNVNELKDPPDESGELKDQHDKTRFDCDKCQQNFKRRGMFVNHMWRIHKVKAGAVPFARQIRHYPCVACSKIYSTAAKRDRHVKLHHPGVSARGVCVGGGWVSGAAAACSLCPRQYATRAKLLQHQRAQHPHLGSGGPSIEAKRH